MKDTTFVGLDAHKDAISVAVVSEHGERPRSLGAIPHTPEAVSQLVRKLGPASRLNFCYEAGPCGYGLYRQLTKLGAQCTVVAPSLIPVKPGDRVKTDRRDAEKLARLHSNGELTPVHVPDEKDEALRGLLRAREDSTEDLQRHRHRLGKFLLRLGVKPPKGVKAWTVKHRQWLDALNLEQPADEIVLREYIHAIDEAKSRIERLEREIETAAPKSRHWPVIKALQSLRGIALINAATIVLEGGGDLTRFGNPRQTMAYTGVCPTEDSSGGSRRRGAITKTGNAHLRRVVVEAAWHYRHKPLVSQNLRKRQEGLSEEVKAIAWKAQHRLNLRYRRLLGRGKPPQKVVVALGRELLGFIWAIAKQVSLEASSSQAR